MEDNKQVAVAVTIGDKENARKALAQFRGSGKGGAVTRLLADRDAEIIMKEDWRCDEGF